MQKDYYRILGVSPEASPEEIRAAFESLSAKLGLSWQTEDLLAEAEEAYAVLSDPQLRTEYNKLYKMFSGLNRGFDGLDVSRAEEQQSLRGLPCVATSAANAKNIDWEFNLDDFDNATVSDLVDVLKTTILSLINEAPSHFKNDLSRDLDNAHIFLDLPLRPKEIKISGYKFLDYHCYIQCSDCGGKGSRRGAPLVDCQACSNSAKTGHCPVCAGLGKYPEENCPKCKGEGRVMARRQAEVKIPKNVQHNAIIQVAGGGHHGFRGLKNGDLFIKVLLTSEENR